MHPILIEIWKLKIYSYGFMLALSFFLGILLAGRRAEKRQVSPELIYDLSIIIVISAIVGSRGLYILTHLDHYQGILDIIALWQGGATYYGGLILAVISSGIYLRIKKASFLQVADIIAPSIGLGIMLTRIGCFLSGCCFGEPTSCPAGMVFPNDAPAGHIFPGMHIHPTQLYASAYGLIIFAVLLLIDRKRRPDGFLFGVLCVLYGVARFLIDFVRYYEGSAIVAGGLTDNQLISAGLFLLGVFLMRFSVVRARRSLGV